MSYTEQYTLGKMRSEIFRALDEYSCNGVEHEMFAGGAGDIDKRLIPAINSAIRLVYLAAGRDVKRRCVEFRAPKILMELCDMLLCLGEEKLTDFPDDSGAVSFWYSGKGYFSVFSADGTELEKIALSSDYGARETYKGFLPSDAEYAVFGAADDSSLCVKKMRSYDVFSVSGCGAELLPDGEKLYCAFSENCNEIYAVYRERFGKLRECYGDMFEYGGGVLSCPERCAGEYMVEYYEYPALLEDNAVLETEIRLSSVCFGAAVYAAAAELCPRENADLYARLTYKYREILANCYPAGNCRRKNGFFSAAGTTKRGKRFFG